MDPVGYHLNELADSLAESAAKRVQYPDHCHQWLKTQEHEAYLVRMRLLAIAAVEVQQHRPPCSPEQLAENKVRRQVLATTSLTARAQQQGHKPQWKQQVLTCTDCGQEATLKKNKWVQQPCPGKCPAQLHPSHHGTAKYHRGILVCTRCGRWAHKKIRSLAQECSIPTAAGRQVLSRLAKGRVWHGLVEWPEPA